MKPTAFIDQLDDAKIIAAIEAAERQSSGEIRVYVSHLKHEDALAAAQRRFEKLGMDQTRQRNAVLIYFSPETQQFAIWGDVGVNERCGELFWHETAAEMTALLKQGHYTEAIVTAIQHIGGILAQYFPREPGDIDELPNQIARD